MPCRACQRTPRRPGRYPRSPICTYRSANATIALFDKPVHRRAVADFTADAVHAIVDQQPPVLYVACDGPRSDDELQAVEEVRRTVLSSTDGVVELRTLFRDLNLGCRRGVEGAISWFLEEEPEGIILEDDCVPSPAFFQFADEMLDRYHDDPTVMHVGGYCHTPTTRTGYRYSPRFPAVWGWATWRRAWAQYPVTLPEMTAAQRRALRGAFASSEELDYFVDKWKAVRDGTLDTWDFSWCFAVMSNHGTAVQPHQNLVRNIGVGHHRCQHHSFEIRCVRSRYGPKR